MESSEFDIFWHEHCIVIKQFGKAFFKGKEFDE
jgi:hypothetical protein